MRGPLLLLRTFSSSMDLPDNVDIASALDVVSVVGGCHISLLGMDLGYEIRRYPTSNFQTTGISEAPTFPLL